MTSSHPSLGDPGDVVEYYPLNPLASDEKTLTDENGESLIVHVPNADIHSIFAHRQWRAGMLMADLIYARILPIKGRSVLELGAGTGLPSIVASIYGQADIVICTDYDSPSLVDTLKDNVNANIRRKDENPVRVIGHTWGKAIDDVKDLVTRSSFDVILLADCIWDDLSHTSLIKSVTSLLTNRIDSRVYMVSGLHTGRDKIVSFIRRAHRAGLQLVPLPHSDNHPWPSLSDFEKEAEKAEKARSSDDEALRNASRYIVEMQLQFNNSEVVSTQSLVKKTRVWQAKTSRLTNKRRCFVVKERSEERKENGGVHIRNTWITFLAIGWANKQL